MTRPAVLQSPTETMLKDRPRCFYLVKSCRWMREWQDSGASEVWCVVIYSCQPIISIHR